MVLGDLILKVLKALTEFLIAVAGVCTAYLGVMKALEPAKRRAARIPRRRSSVTQRKSP
ncbi:hypothetical protein EDC14_10462 [Hydrogenispora ethanolica]|jgi:hypothetical protein|uniref:Uncharacterized protein n=1 Tax=Hydrogenispora ethanolica TaxID=1082276 RepID=A0A4V2QBW1_HYDET|nr:hypothetical protein EDC14_10462 [Hydrogenispora ethanolica]